MSHTRQSRSRRSALIDELMDRYVEWREQCVTLKGAYEHWLSRPTSERRLAFEAYKAALDLEEHASLVYEDRIRRFQRLEQPRFGRFARLGGEPAGETALARG